VGDASRHEGKRDSKGKWQEPGPESTAMGRIEMQLLHVRRKRDESGDNTD